MAFEFHQNKEVYFQFQFENAQKYVLPFIEKYAPVNSAFRVLEIGCGEAGVLKAFTQKGCQCVGIELHESRLEDARKFMAQEIQKGEIQLINKNIYDIIPEKDLPFLFDLILLKDVIEHIPEQNKFMRHLTRFLSPKGKVFFGFPPWQMPFGGHQQICHSKFLSLLPYFHLLPRFLYLTILKVMNEPQSIIRELDEIKETGISIERFERICRDENFTICLKKFFLINPIYEYKFGLKTRQQNAFLAKLPWIRNFLTTAVYYLIEKKQG